LYSGHEARGRYIVPLARSTPDLEGFILAYVEAAGIAGEASVPSTFD